MGALGHELNMSMDDYHPNLASDEQYEVGVKMYESARIVQGFSWYLSTASDICKRRRNIVDLKALDPMFFPEKQRIPEFSLCIKVAFHPDDVQMLPGSQTWLCHCSSRALDLQCHFRSGSLTTFKREQTRHGNMYSGLMPMIAQDWICQSLLTGTNLYTSLRPLLHSHSFVT
jgi:hypothetical protein